MATEELTERVDKIDERLDRLTTEIEGLKDSHKLMRENIKDVLFGLELLGDRTNQMIDGINRNEAAIGKLAAAQARTDEAIQNLALKQAETSETVDRLSKTVDRYLSARLNGNN